MVCTSFWTDGPRSQTGARILRLQNRKLYYYTGFLHKVKQFFLFSGNFCNLGKYLPAGRAFYWFFSASMAAAGSMILPKQQVCPPFSWSSSAAAVSCTAWKNRSGVQSGAAWQHRA